MSPGTGGGDTPHLLYIDDDEGLRRLATLALTRRGFSVTTAASGRDGVDHLGTVDLFLATGYAALGDPRALEHAREAVVLNGRLECLPWRRRAETLVARLS